MAILVISRPPGGGKPPTYEQVNQQIQSGDRPDGLILFAAGDNNGTFEVYAIFESREKYDAFLNGVLRPAIKAAAGDEAYAAMPEAERIVVELDDLVVA